MLHKISPVVLVAVALAASLLGAAAQSQAPRGPVERLTAKAANVSNSGEQVSIDVLRWSTDADRNRLTSVFAWYGEKEMAGAMPTVGYLWTTESAGYSIRYAYRTQASDGSQKIILLTDRRLGLGNQQTWRPSGAAAAAAAGEDYPFTLIELRLNRNGQGEGKASLTGKLTVDSTGSLALENYAASPVILSGVARATAR